MPTQTSFYSSYISTYLDRDVRRLFAGIDDLKFLGFLRAAAARTGQQLNYKGIADDAEIDLLLEQDGKLFPIEIKKMAAPPKKLTKGI